MLPSVWVSRVPFLHLFFSPTWCLGNVGTSDPLFRLPGPLSKSALPSCLSQPYLDMLSVSLTVLPVCPPIITFLKSQCWINLTGPILGQCSSTAWENQAHLKIDATVYTKCPKSMSLFPSLAPSSIFQGGPSTHLYVLWTSYPSFSSLL